MPKHLTPVERAVALVLGLVWTLGGATAMVLGLRAGDWLPGALSIFALLYGMTWLRVTALGRVLSWQESLRF